jgi:hypothetical protein
MDILLTLILSCSVHLDDSLVEALAYKLSIGNQYFVADLTTLNTYDTARTASDALRVVDAIKASGGRPAVGYMSVPLDWAARFGRRPEDLFDGCTNIAIGTAMLSDYARLCTARPARRSSRSTRPRRPMRPSLAMRTCILRRLESDINLLGIVDHVLPVVARVDAAAADPWTDPPAARSPLFPDNTDSSQDGHEWSSPRLFPFPTAHPPVPPEPPASSPGRPSARASPPSPSPSPATPSAPAGPSRVVVPAPSKRR